MVTDLSFDRSETACSPLAYLMSQSHAGKWTTSTFCDLLALIGAWTRRESRHQRTDIVHVGFSKPTLPVLRDLVSDVVGSVLLTETAKNALPAGFKTSPMVIGEVDGLPIFVGMQGWGSPLSKALLQTASDSLAENFMAEGWVRNYLGQHPQDEKCLAAKGIYNEATYIAREVGLPSVLRHKIGVARLDYLVQADTKDPCEIIKGAPPWLLVQPLEEIKAAERVSNVFAASSIYAVKDLLTFDLGRLLRLPKFGKKSAADLTSALLKALNEGPKDQFSQPDNRSNAFVVDQSLSVLSERERDVWCRRMGHDRARQTLQQISEEYGVSRERIRQIQASAGRKLSRPFTAGGQ